MPIVKELSLRGHQVVVLTSHPYNDTFLSNLTEISTNYMTNCYSGVTQTKYSTKHQTSYEITKRILEMSSTMAEMTFNNVNFKRIYENTEEHFDLIIVHNMSPVFYSLSSRFKAPIISISTLDGRYNHHNSQGNINNPSIYGDIIYQDFQSRSLKSRLLRFSYYMWYHYFYYWQYLPSEDKIARKYLGNELPYLGDLENNVSAMFLNGNLFTSPIRPTVPTTVYLTQLHIRPVQELPKV